MAQGPWTRWDESSAQKSTQEGFKHRPALPAINVRPDFREPPVPRGGDFVDQEWDGKPRWIADEAAIQHIPGD